MTRALALSLRDRFAGQGAQVVEPPVLLPADVLLDLYGEDIRGRAYVTADALRGEQMLRPDFTVPVVQMHMAQGASPARYTYAGEVFRRQDDDPDRENEYLQVGYEVFDDANPAAADAEVFASLRSALAPLSLRAATGDIGILMSAVDGLQTSDRRKAALRRHIWRPRRFRALLDRFGGRTPMPATRAALLTGDVPASGPLNGLRSRAEIEARIDALREDAALPPISVAEMEGLDALLNVRETLPYAVDQLQALCADLPAIEPAVHRLRDRAEALSAQGVDIATLAFEASYGRTSMEYYDGFVFGFYADGRPDLPPVASGGRYDALTRRLGGADGIPAVGGVIRPGLVAALEGTT
ncbi:ATP phosphoribosyltransferase regulatory subunit [Tateyamaria sp. SN6-1]|uniref:ATP phosphoribosyltransferase regulatory subunit n=1 Tax=Tateyamaria sp. SN6-1 TaxID=3092148 RepID=UPI0039F549E2